jgi:tryptophan-rich sensory protein
MQIWPVLFMVVGFSALALYSRRSAQEMDWVRLAVFGVFVIPIIAILARIPW